MTGERGNADMQMRQRDVAALYAEELADVAENDVCVMMLPLVVITIFIKAVWQISA